MPTGDDTRPATASRPTPPAVGASWPVRPDSEFRRRRSDGAAVRSVVVEDEVQAVLDLAIDPGAADETRRRLIALIQAGAEGMRRPVADADVRPNCQQGGGPGASTSRAAGDRRGDGR